MNAPANIEVEAPVRRRRPRALLAGAGAALLALAGTVWIALPASSETTDNAYLRADSTQLAARIAGQVAQVLVRDNQVVHAGDPLVRIDDREFAAKLAAAQAAVRDADAAVAAATPYATGKLLSVGWPTEREATWTIQFETPGAPAEVKVADAGALATPPEADKPETLARTMRRWHDGTDMGFV
ncbi:MAG: biotin/lipoyl-binding protein, partial [Sphingopyxis sp.]|nr:biotin/lipoyl-binding protein [Sphingopyxis sp.]